MYIYVCIYYIYVYIIYMCISSFVLFFKRGLKIKVKSIKSKGIYGICCQVQTHVNQRNCFCSKDILPYFHQLELSPRSGI